MYHNLLKFEFPAAVESTCDLQSAEVSCFAQLQFLVQIETSKVNLTLAEYFPNSWQATWHLIYHKGDILVIDDEIPKGLSSRCAKYPKVAKIDAPKSHLYF